MNLPDKTIATEAVSPCWNAIGVGGDRSCPKLPELGHCRNCRVYADHGRAMFDRPLSEDYRAQATAAFAAASDDGPSEASSVLVFRLRDEWLALHTPTFLEAAEASPIRTIPLRSDASLLGLVNIHGELLPCVSLLPALGLSDASPDDVDGPKEPDFARFLILAWESQRFVLPVDDVYGIIVVPHAELGTPPATVAARPKALTTAVFELDDREVSLLDDNRVLAALQRGLNA